MNSRTSLDVQFLGNLHGNTRIEFMVDAAQHETC
jgi:hypothetical protein